MKEGKMKKETNVTLVTVAIFIATFMSAIEGTIVSTAMPTIVGDLHGMNLMNWIFSIYLLTNAMLTPIYGKLADRVGRKSVFIVGLLLFIIGSALCGFAQNMMTLIIFRALQGMGAGAILPLSFTIIADIYPIEKRAKILGFNSSAWGIASVVAPLLGGFIVEQLSWHWIFFINVPIGLITIWMISHYLNEPKREVIKAPIDYRGSLFLMLTLLCVMYGFQVLEHGFSLVLVLMFVIAIICFLLFIKTEKTATDPIISLALFKNRTFNVQNLVAALVSGFLMGFEVYMPMWMQGILGLPASMGGFVVTPSSLMWVVASFITGGLLAKYTPRFILFWSLALLACGSFVLAVLPETTSFSTFLIVAAFLGLGFGVTITTTTVVSQNSVSKDQIGVATSFNTLCRTLGQTLMVSVYGIILNLHLASGVAKYKHSGITSDMMNRLVNPQTATSLPAKLLPTLREILYSGLHVIYMTSVILMILAIIVNLFGKRKKVVEQ
ncbi:MDR family MFS transporter [Loigolactobacillus backii]|uniref:MDR family MFS transporter n=1 Tax=Loigolactobacillus backii TaxID=375175 RepID=UPI00177EBEB1